MLNLNFNLFGTLEQEKKKKKIMEFIFKMCQNVKLNQKIQNYQIKRYNVKFEFQPISL